MSKEEIKYEINKVLDEFSDKSLEDLLSILKSIDIKNYQLFGSDTLKKVLVEDHELLQKLAQ